MSVPVCSPTPAVQVAMLSSPELPSELVNSVYEFGRHLGMAFQLIDDVLDFVSREDQLGKPSGGSDLQMGIATAPVLFAAQRVRWTCVCSRVRY